MGLLSTGLKADVECDDLEADKAMFNRKELDNYNNIYEDHSKDIVFKVYNFKKSFTRDFKKKARHYITYAFYQDWGIKRFISEKKSVFFYKQNSLNFVLDFLFFQKSFSSILVN